MTEQEFIPQALKTESVPQIPMHQHNVRLLHAVMGMATEVGELLDAAKKHLFYGKPLDIVNVAEELGDVEWYRAILLDELDLHPDMIRAACIAKLRKRYGDKFDSLKAVTRDLDTERKTLEANL